MPLIEREKAGKWAGPFHPPQPFWSSRLEKQLHRRRSVDYSGQGGMLAALTSTCLFKTAHQRGPVATDKMWGRESSPPAEDCNQVTDLCLFMFRLTDLMSDPTAPVPTNFGPCCENCARAGWEESSVA